MKPTLSVVIPHFNHGRFIANAVRAITSQSWPPLEILVVDDASTDGSIHVLRDLAAQIPRLRLIEGETNLGVAARLNQLVAEARGDYLIGCAADDLVLPGLFERSMRALQQHPDAAICSSLTYLMDEHDVVTGVLETPVISGQARCLSGEGARKVLRRYGFWIVGNTAVFRRDALLAAGGFIPELGPTTDSVVQHALAVRHGACFVPEAMAALRQLESSFSASSAADFVGFDTFIAAATTHMTTTYGDVYGSTFAARWRKEMRLSFGLHQLDRASRGWGDTLSSLATAGFSSRTRTRHLLRALGSGSALLHKASRAVLFLDYTPAYIVRRRLLRRFRSVRKG